MHLCPYGHLYLFVLYSIAHMGDIINMDFEGKCGRPKCIRSVEDKPKVNYFKPRGIPLTELESVQLKVEELEAIKLIYYDKLQREDAAKKMGVSRRTLERELKSGLSKVVDGLLNGKAIEISGGYYLAKDEMIFQCLDDRFTWKAKKNAKQKKCPECGGKKITEKNEK